MDRVSVVRCAAAESDDEITRRTREAIEMLGDYGVGLRGARKIAVKINAGINRVILTDGRQTELTEPAVVEGAIQAIRAVTDAEIVVGDGPTDGTSAELYARLGYPERLAKYANVRLLDFLETEPISVEMMHAGAMFSSYMIPRELAEADAVVSLAKMKAHVSVGCTLSIKNLFGWLPTSIYGVPRTYLHDRLIRLPRVLADLACHFKPCLNVVDGIIAANKSEWHGEALRPGVILAGTNSVATDSAGMRVMGFDPNGDYPDHPFFYRRSVVKLAAELGLGSTTDFELLGVPPEEVCTPFNVQQYDGDTNRAAQLRHGAECVAAYRANQDNFADRYAGRYLALFNGDVRWEAQDMAAIQKIEQESGLDWQSVPQFIVKCLPAAEEIERFDWYKTDCSA